MLPKIPIAPPAAYASATAVGFADSSGNLNIVGRDGPLPVATVRNTPPMPLEGEVMETTVAGPFAPLPGQPMHLELGGDWTGQVELLRSIDGGITHSPVTLVGMPWARFTANANEVVWQEAEEDVVFFLGIRIDSGTLSYRLSQ